MAGGTGFLVMPAGQFDERRLLGDVNDGEVVMGTGKAGLELNGLAQGVLGGAAEALFTKGEAEEVLDLGILRVELGGAAERVNGGVVILLTELETAQDEKGVRVIRGKGDSLLDVDLGGLEVVEVEFNRREPGEGGNIVLILLQDLQVLFLGFVELSVGVVTLRLGGERHGAGRQLFDGSLAALGGRRGLPGGWLLEEGQFLRGVRDLARLKIWRRARSVAS